MSKILDKEEIIKMIPDGATIALNGSAEEIVRAIEESFLSSGHPKDLTIIAGAGAGDFKEKGLNHLAHQGLLKRIITSHIGLNPKLAKLVFENKLEAYNFPFGVISKLYREISRGESGVLTKLGLNTFVDPRISGGKQNERTKEDLVEIVNFKGEEYLYYKAIPIDFCLIKVTTADEEGNLTMEREIAEGCPLSLSIATKNSGGKVIAQAGRIAEVGSLKARDVVVPGNLVDFVVKGSPENQWQTFFVEYNPAFSGEIKIPLDDYKKLNLDAEKIIARRCLLEIKKDDLINVGFGIPAKVPYIAFVEEGLKDLFTNSVELGQIGGVPNIGIHFGPSANFKSVMDVSSYFDFVEGGGLSKAFLAFGQIDEKGNVNVSRFSPLIIGSGGFMEITYRTKNIIFCGTFTYPEPEIEILNNELKIKKDGFYKKFVNKVEEITFPKELIDEKNILVITERCVFKLERDGLILTEIATGIDLEKDILSLMEFKPKISSDLKKMDSKIFKDEKMGITLE